MIDIEVTGADEVAARLRSFPDRLRSRLAAVLERVGGVLGDRVRDKLGGDVLHMRSGRLAGGLTLAVDTGDGTSVTLGIDGDAVPYAAYQEFGFHGSETVRAQLRTIKAAFGRPIAPRQVAVRGYTRRVDYPAHSFLRSALADIAPDAVAEIAANVGDEAQL
jgi:phage gpG-like protein